MAAGNMAGFVGQDADNFVRRIRIHDRAGIDENMAPIHHESVECTTIDDDNADVLFRQTGDAQNRLGIVSQELLDFRVANCRRSTGGEHLCRKTGSDQSTSRHHSDQP